ncbi:hypothetical protein [Chitinimonas sp. BJB300]|uniref:hypothetical protein n=1 Tax=Chitinimonas sp. BJB300 TaxID=1559339 RepID=UPI0011129D9C|nr:hypothetical protein [Chitinimonas sp. BJB300]TSJ84472.1 hypothetical protein FG002_020205 [Chitinimonas sp. BJB300]
MSQRKGVVSHDEAEAVELRADRELAAQYLKASVESLANPDECAAGLLGLRAVVAAFGGLDGVALRSVCRPSIPGLSTRPTRCHKNPPLSHQTIVWLPTPMPSHFNALNACLCVK